MKKIIVAIKSRFVHSAAPIPPIDKELLVMRHPELIYFFNQKEQIAILSRLWYQGKLSTSQCIALNPEMDAVIDDIIDTCQCI